MLIKRGLGDPNLKEAYVNTINTPVKWYYLPRKIDEGKVTVVKCRFDIVPSSHILYEFVLVI